MSKHGTTHVDKIKEKTQSSICGLCSLTRWCTNYFLEIQKNNDGFSAIIASYKALPSRCINSRYKWYLKKGVRPEGFVVRDGGGLELGAWGSALLAEQKEQGFSGGQSTGGFISKVYFLCMWNRSVLSWWRKMFAFRCSRNQGWRCRLGQMMGAF